MYDPCYYRDINYESLLEKNSYEDLLKTNTGKDKIKACTSWQYNTSEFGDTITSEVIYISNKRKKLKLKNKWPFINYDS